MREIVRGTLFCDTGEITTRDMTSSEFMGSRGTHQSVLILPIEDGKCGPFEKWMVGYMQSKQVVTPEKDEQIAAAISRLFEEVESED